MSDDDRKQRRSWREIDRNRDVKSNRGAPAVGSEKTLKGQAAKRYRSQLDKIFAGGALPDSLRQQAPNMASMEKSERHLRAEAVLKASEPKEVQAAVAEMLAHDPMPSDPELLVKVLADSSGKHAISAIESLLEVLESGRPNNARLLKTRLQTLKLTTGDDDIDRLADCAIALL